MESKNLVPRVAGTLFGIVAILHLLRILTQAPVLIDGWLLPIWVNYLGVIVAGFLCGLLWRYSFQKKDDSAYYITDRNRYK